MKKSDRSTLVRLIYLCIGVSVCYAAHQLWLPKKKGGRENEVFETRTMHRINYARLRVRDPEARPRTGNTPNTHHGINHCSERSGRVMRFSGIEGGDTGG